MKKSFAFFALAFLCGGLYAALPTVTGSAARQRWPFDGKVAIDFTLGRGDCCDVQLSATWDGQETPYVFQERALDGFSSCNLAPNCAYTVMWDPAKDGFTAKEYKNFRVTVTPVSVTDRMFLYVDIVNGTNCWYGQGVTDSAKIRTDAYLKNGILFRRVLAGPSGTYTNGLPAAARAAKLCDNPDEAPKTITNTNDSQPVGFSSDYFISTTLITTWQANKLGITQDEGYAVYSKCSFHSMRGATNAVAGTADDVRWPATGFHVKSTSQMQTFRNKLGPQLPSGWIVDIPTFTQNEIAARAGDWQHLWWNGGDSTCSAETLTNLCNASSAWRCHNYKTHPGDFPAGGDTVPGQRGCNPWGLWEPNGILWMLSLDNNGTTASDFSGVDPVGSQTWNDNVKCTSCNTDWGMLPTVPARSYGNAKKSTGCCFRLVINTSNWPGKPL